MRKQLSDFDNAIDELRKGSITEFPPLREGTERGRSYDISVGDKCIRFKRGKSYLYADIANMREVFEKLIEGEAFLQISGIFRHGCEKTFFLQLLKYFDLAEIVGEGTVNNPYKVVIK